MKKCSKCYTIKKLSEFTNRKISKDGKAASCKLCDSLNKKEYYIKNKLTIIKNIKRKSVAEMSQQELSKVRNRRLKYYYKHINNPVFKLRVSISNLIRYGFTINTYTKKLSSETILGCSFEEFKLYLESKFESWMNWDNRGLYNGAENYGWDIDHIIPISSAICEDDVIRLNHYTNLQPLCSKVNRDIKRDN